MVREGRKHPAQCLYYYQDALVMSSSSANKLVPAIQRTPEIFNNKLALIL